MLISELRRPKEIIQVMRDIGVDPYGIEIMLPKTIHYLLRLGSVSNITANILKQEMLSLGADAAVARGALTGRVKKTACLLMGTLSQLKGLARKLNQQPFGLNKLSRDLSAALDNYQRDSFTLSLGRYKLNLGRRAHIMGILNVTPDSFSGDGLYKNRGAAYRNRDYILAYARRLASDGADIIDVGAESSRPGAKPISEKQELERAIPVIKALARNIKLPISIDTYKPLVAKAALDNGACLVNDITGLRNPKMARVVKEFKAGAVIMHMKGRPSTMQKNPQYVSLIEEIAGFLAGAINHAQEQGIDKEKIIIDPGIGFGKSHQDNLEILRRLNDFKILGRPILVGPSRKSFIGKILNAGPQERIFGTISACALAVNKGARIIRAHDVKELNQALKVIESIKK